MLRKVLSVLGVYIILTIIVSTTSFLFSTDSLTDAGSTKSYTITVESQQEEPVSSEESTEPGKTNPSDSQPFDFSVNVITDVDEPTNKAIILSKSLPKTEPPDVLGTLLVELKRRTHFIVRICMRKRCNRIRR